MGETVPGWGSAPPPAAGNPGRFVVPYRVCTDCAGCTDRTGLGVPATGAGWPYSQDDHGPGAVYPPGRD